jgi:hypothetical protein
MILQDEDITTKIENDWKRLNTLAHYQVRCMWRMETGHLPKTLKPRLDPKAPIHSSPVFPVPLIA